ncbi:hypothetical protein [Caballeronia sp. GAWG1-5s-s]|uniref:hypothetical protein n=1 Tax=Caballeronia sp. GAWG1-5s-s TaxID=2921743 RepID=UPI0020277291|nr:hypothetical protein [Caballeronia sp. GAWG1-5s-s]
MQVIPRSPRIGYTILLLTLLVLAAVPEKYRQGSAFVVSLATLLATAYSARQTAKSASAAAKSVEVSTAAQCPRFIVSSSAQAWGRQEAGGLVIHTAIELKNCGATAAEIIRKSLTCSVLSSSFPTDADTRALGSKQQSFMGEIIEGGDPLTISVEFGTSDSEPMPSDTKVLIRGQIVYRDYLDELWVKHFGACISLNRVDVSVNRQIPSFTTVTLERCPENLDRRYNLTRRLPHARAKADAATSTS